MWQLSMTNAAKEWTSVGTFDTVIAAARRIREIEGYPTTPPGSLPVRPHAWVVDHPAHTEK
jgi:hypothetical protein